MGKDVYANGNEIACKAGDGKVVAAFPDVCLSPPSPPAGPLPVPYPDSSFSSDTNSGSRSVTIGGKAVALKDQSFYKSSPLGDEAATRSFGASIITHTITGKTYFAAWSMDVMFEGKNVARHTDVTTSNHSSMPGATPPNPNLGAMKVGATEDAERKCKCCQGPVHSQGTPTDFDTWYGLNATDASGQPTAKAAARKALVEKIKNKKAHGCTCDGRILPEAPCNVFRTPVTKDEHTAIVRAHGRNADRFRSLVGVQPYAWWKANFPQSQENLQKQVQVNHLVPKNAGGCPTGFGNLQAHGQLCRLCQSFDRAFGSWQKEVATI